MELILLGAPGAGKGTQAEVICDHLHIPSVSTGNLLREAVKNQTEYGMKAKSFMDSGKLVPDEIVLALLKERIAQDDCKGGFILDGFPRTVAQAQTLEEMGVIVDAVIDIEVPDEAITQRMSGRRVCEACGASYHIVSKPTKVDGVCDRCGGKLVVRKDDQPETVKDRLNVYHNQTEPLIEYYKKSGKLKVVDGQGDVSEVSSRTLVALEA